VSNCYVGSLVLCLPESRGRKCEKSWWANRFVSDVQRAVRDTELLKGKQRFKTKAALQGLSLTC
jgi:hypothetical protein